MVKVTPFEELHVTDFSQLMFYVIGNIDREVDSWPGRNKDAPSPIWRWVLDFKNECS